MLLYNHIDSKCPRCAGAMVVHHNGFKYLGELDEGDHCGPLLHCINCGFYADAVMVRNKQLQRVQAQTGEEAVA